jgi:hypothetical protein
MGFLLKGKVMGRWRQQSTAADRPSELAIEGGILALGQFGIYRRSTGDARILAKGMQILT